jgi:hypothetical protein
MTVYKKCFKADDAINSFRVAFPNEITSEEKAIAFGRMLQRAQLMTHVVDPKKPFRSGHFFFRLQCYQQPEILNSFRIYQAMSEGEPMDLIDLIASCLMKVEQTSSSPETGLVDYRIAHKSQHFSMFEDVVCKLQALDLASLDESTRMAVVINIYNIMMRYAFMKVGVPDARSTRSQFFSEVKMNIGGDILSFDDLEHGILRGNRLRYGAAMPQFGAKDHRARLALSNVEPRVLFALSFSPLVTGELAIIYPNTLHYDLQRETVKYLSKMSNLILEVANHTLHLNKMFHWYKSDFGTSDWPRLAHFLEKGLHEGNKKSLLAIIETRSPPKIVYLDFDWGTAGGKFFPFRPRVLKANEKRIL